MKKIIKIMMVLLLVLGISACHNTGEDTKDETYQIIDKTFANETTKSKYFRGSITIYKEGDFELYEYIQDKLVLVRGDYKQRGNEYDLYPNNNSILPEKIVFKALSDEKLVLDTDLYFSGSGDSYIPEDQIKDEEVEQDPVIFYSTVKKENDLDVSSLELYKDGTFRLVEIQGYGATLVEGRYGTEGNVLMFSNFDMFYDMYGNEVHNFEFFYLDEDTITLNEDLNSTAYGTIFTKSGELPEKYKQQVSHKPVLIFTHEPIADVNDEYLPRITMYEDGTFEFVENVYAGMATVKGTYESIPKAYRFTVEDNSQMMGFAGDDVTQFVIYHDDAYGDYRIDTDICMTRTDDFFFLKNAQ